MPKLNLSPMTIFIGVYAAFLFLLLSICLSFQRFLRLQTASDWTTRSYQVLQETSEITRGLTEIPSGVRGFLQTGNEASLKPYHAGKAEYEGHYATALQLTRDRLIQQKRLKLLGRQYEIWMKGHIDPLIRMRRATPSTQRALALAAPGIRKRRIIMNAMLKTIASLEKTENGLLQQRSQREGLLRTIARAAIAATDTFMVLFAAGLCVLLGGVTRGLQRSRLGLKEQTAQRARAEQEAQILDRHNKMILLSAQEGIAGVNQAGRTTFFNPAAEAITGYSEAEMIGKSQHEVLHSRRADGSPYPISDCPIMATLKDGMPHKADDEVFWHKDGSPIPIEFTSSPLMMPSDGDGTPGGAKQDGRLVGAVIVFRDIADRRKSEAAMQEYSSIVQYSDDSIISLTLSGVITRWNQAATKVYGYEPGEMVGQHFSRLMSDEELADLPVQLERIKNLQPIDRYETTHRRKDGKPVEVVISLSPMVDKLGRVVGAATISREVFRSRMRREAELRGQNGGTA